MIAYTKQLEQNIAFAFLGIFSLYPNALSTEKHLNMIYIGTKHNIKQNNQSIIVSIKKYEQPIII